jgi:hypothetical protein
MNVRDKSRFKTGGIRLYTLVPAALACVLLLCACDFPGAPPNGASNLTVYLSGARNGRSVLSDSAISSFEYKVTFTGPDGTVIERNVAGESISLTLSTGEWIVEAWAYNSAAVLAGSGTKTVTVVPGQYQSVTIPMYVDSVYESGLTDIYIHNEAELRRIGAPDDFAIDGSFITHFYLERDIVLTDWTPIGTSGLPFKAVFDGQGHTITIRSFASSALSGTCLGLFGYTNTGADIKNLTIKYTMPSTTSPSGTQYLGGLVGDADNTQIDKVHVSGTIDYTNSGGTLNIGGLVGGGDSTEITDSSFTGTLRGTVTSSSQSVFAGGILGISGTTGVLIKTSYAAGQIYATSSQGNVYAGGIAGQWRGSGVYTTIENCYSWAAIMASAASGSHARVGGLLGDVYYTSSTIRKCYARGTVTAAGGTIRAGGIVGDTGTSNVGNCVALVQVNGGVSDTVGYVIGQNNSGNPPPTTNYAASDITITRNGTLDPGVVDQNNTAYARVNFQSQTVYDTLGWDFASSPPDWYFVGGYDYPVLSWQTRAPADPAALP